MWLEAHKHCYMSDVVYNEEHPRLRWYGYVLWDAPCPLIKEDLLQKQMLDARRRSLLDVLQLSDSRDKMKKSWKERTAIYKNGGRGYWDEGDLSQVVWDQVESQEVRSDCDTKGKGLDNARYLKCLFICRSIRPRLFSGSR